jgi:acetyl-CoA acetyltransferase
MSRRACIVGIGETTFSRESDEPSEALIAESIALALADAGLEAREVQGLAVTSMHISDDSPYIAEHLGFELEWVLKADYGGAAGIISVLRAQQAIEAGYIDIAVCTGGDNRIPQKAHDVPRPSNDYSRRNFVDPYGYGGPNSLFALLQRLHMDRYGTTLEQLGKIAVTFRRHAQLNPNALLRDSMTIADYVQSRMISDPIRLLDCVMPCCGAEALVITTEDVAERLGREPIFVGRGAERVNYQARVRLPDKLTTGFKPIGEKILQSDDRRSLDFLQLYDDYPIAVLMTLEDLGFCEKGGGGAFIEATDLSFDGELPMNTGGGQLSMGQPILGGGHLHLVEAVRQLRGQAGARQIRDPKRGLVTGIGLLSYHSNVACNSAVILGRGRP